MSKKNWPFQQTSESEQLQKILRGRKQAIQSSVLRSVCRALTVHAHTGAFQQRRDTELRPDDTEEEAGMGRGRNSDSGAPEGGGLKCGQPKKNYRLKFAVWIHDNF